MIGNVYHPPKIEFTPVLNAGLRWEDVETGVHDAFRGQVKLVKLRAGFRLYKFTQFDLRPAGAVTPWWSPFGQFAQDPGLEERLREAASLGKDPADRARVLLAVRKDWNSLTHILTAKLLKDVYGFWGRTGWQPRFGVQSVEHMRRFDQVLGQLTGSAPIRLGLDGGAGQFFIPNLIRNEHLRRGVWVSVEQLLSGEVHLW